MASADHTNVMVANCQEACCQLIFSQTICRKFFFAIVANRMMMADFITSGTAEWEVVCPGRLVSSPDVGRMGSYISSLFSELPGMN